MRLEHIGKTDRHQPGRKMDKLATHLFRAGIETPKHFRHPEDGQKHSADNQRCIDFGENQGIQWELFFLGGFLATVFLDDRFGDVAGNLFVMVELHGEVGP